MSIAILAKILKRADDRMPITDDHGNVVGFRQGGKPVPFEALTPLEQHHVRAVTAGLPSAGVSAAPTPVAAPAATAAPVTAPAPFVGPAQAPGPVQSHAAVVPWAGPAPQPAAATPGRAAAAMNAAKSAVKGVNPGRVTKGVLGSLAVGAAASPFLVPDRKTVLDPKADQLDQLQARAADMDANTYGAKAGVVARNALGAVTPGTSEREQLQKQIDTVTAARKAKADAEAERANSFSGQAEKFMKGFHWNPMEMDNPHRAVAGVGALGAAALLYHLLSSNRRRDEE